MIDFQQVYKSYGGQKLFENASFRLNTGDKAGIVGPNGTGKSTIFRMIVGEEQCDKGSIATPKNYRITYLRQNLDATDLNISLLEYTENAIPELLTLHHEIEQIENKIKNVSSEKEKGHLINTLGILQTKYEHIGGYSLRQKAEAALSGLGFPVSRFNDKFSSFSGGWQMRANLAKTLIADADILLLDEPSNYLDVPAIEWMKRYLSFYGGTLVIISHDRYLLNSLTNIILEINGGTVTRYAGNYDFYSKERVLREQYAQAARATQETKIKEIEKFIDRFRYKATKSAQVQSRIKMLEKMEKISPPQKILYSCEMHLPVPSESGNEVFRMENISFSYDSQRWILNDVKLSIQRGDKIGLVGYNGMGKTTLLKIIVGVLSPNRGKRMIGHNVVMGYQAQEFSDILKPKQTVFDTLRTISPNTSNLRNLLGSFGFSGEDIEKPCAVLSGGEQIRLLFARIFSLTPNFLILDEPTTHLDLMARESLQNAISSYKGTVCFVSHDIEFLKNAATTILAIGNGQVKKYYGNYEYYLQKISENSLDNVKQKPGKIEINDRKVKKKQKAETRQQFWTERKKLEAQVNSIEKEIEQLELEKENLLSALLIKSNNVDFPSVNKRLKELETNLNALANKWELSAKKLENATKEHKKEIENLL
jgi:ATP-binding cassette subfamily F protein 3